MTFETLRAFKRHILLWPRHLLMAGGLCLLAACGGGGGGGSSVAVAEPVPTLENSSLDLAPFYPGKSIFLKPSYSTGTGKITWVNASGATGELSISGSGTLVQHNPLSTTNYTLTVTYADPAKLNTMTSKTAALTVTVTPVTVPPVTLDLSQSTLTTGRSDHASVRLPDGRVLVSGGTDGTAVLKSAEVFDPSTEKWASATDMKTARRGHTMTLLQDNKVLVTGGFDGKSALATAEIYDPSSNTWTATLGPMALSHRFHTATLLPDGNVLIAGGVAGPLLTADPKTTEIYTPTTGLFTTKTGPSLEEARQGHTATLLGSSKVLFVGNSGDNTAAAKILTYNSTTPASSTWSATSAMKKERYNHTATLLDTDPNTVVVIGGGVAPSTVEIYNISSNEWSDGRPMSTARSLHTSTELLDGRILVVGGYDGQQSLTSIEIYTPSTNTWQTYAKVLNSARAMHTGTLMNNGNVLMVGSYFQTSGTILKTTEIWRP